MLVGRVPKQPQDQFAAELGFRRKEVFRDSDVLAETMMRKVMDESVGGRNGDAEIVFDVPTGEIIRERIEGGHTGDRGTPRMGG